MITLLFFDRNVNIVRGDSVVSFDIDRESGVMTLVYDRDTTSTVDIRGMHHIIVEQDGVRSPYTIRVDNVVENVYTN